jgi:hypothetical protein
MKSIHLIILEKAMLKAKKDNLIKSKQNAKLLSCKVIREPCYLINILNFFSITELLTFQLMSTYIKNLIFDNADSFGCLNLAKKVRYWGMDGLITKFHHIVHFNIDFFIASVDINVFLKVFE